MPLSPLSVNYLASEQWSVDISLPPRKTSLLQFTTVEAKTQHILVNFAFRSERLTIMMIMYVACVFYTSVTGIVNFDSCTVCAFGERNQPFFNFTILLRVRLQAVLLASNCCLTSAWWWWKMQLVMR